MHGCEVTLPISHGQVCGGSSLVLSSTRKCPHGRGRTSMHPSVLLMVCLLTLYVVTMVMFWHGIGGQQPVARLETAGQLALPAGQTIVGVVETAQGLAFAIGEYVRDAQYEEG